MRNNGRWNITLGDLVDDGKAFIQAGPFGSQLHLGDYQTVEGMVESFTTLQEELEKERRAMERIWSKREKQLQRAVTNTVGMYGDFQGIVGASLPQIAQLELPGPTAISDEIDDHRES